MRPALACAALLALLPVAAFGQAAGQWRDSAHIWRSLCRYCHETSIAPALFGLALPDTVTITTVRTGHNGMPAFTSTQVNDAELRALAQWMAAQPAPASGPQP